MVTLALNNSPGGHLLRLVPREDKGFWEVLIDRGPWDEDERGKSAINKFKTIEPMVMAQKDLVQFAKEIRNALEKKSIEEQKLNLTLERNLPQFRVGIQFVDGEAALYRQKYKGKFSFMPSINLKFSTFQSGREDDQYLYEKGGRHTGIVQYYSFEELLKFAYDLEKEAKITGDGFSKMVTKKGITTEVRGSFLNNESISTGFPYIPPN